ncbi:hypothetical protein BC827DRAFT_1382953 [Russula dissimulans]|jgi:hypothetical protein|nr:hypothetical protein BC827DRAFT_1382953 [Russula dissimulans]
MFYRTLLISRIPPRATVPAVQGGRFSAHHSRTLATVGSRPTTDHMESPRPKTKLGVDRETLYIGGGLAAIGALWYYYATVEHARIERKRERLDTGVATASTQSSEGGSKRQIEDAAHSAKSRAQEALKRVQ